MGKYKYVKSSPLTNRILRSFPNAGPRPNITGMRRIWGKDAHIIKCGQYAYCVPHDIFYAL